LFLVLFGSLADFTIALGMTTTLRTFMRRLLLLLSLVVNLGLLGFFKHLNFFASSFADVFTLFGIPFEATRLQLVLPTSICF
jgi:alginate O-acetyltransferase complex protein AlgI